MKWTHEQKIKIAEECEKLGSEAVSKKWGMDRSYVLRIAKSVGERKLAPRGLKKQYLPDFKIQVIKAYLNGEGTYVELAKKFNIPSMSTITYWHYVYKSRGEEGLRGMKGKGRPGSDRKKPKPEADMDSLLEPGRTEYSKDEIESMKRELARLLSREELSKNCRP